VSFPLNPSDPAGVGYEASAGRDTGGLSNAWGGLGGGSFIRRIFNAVVPVTIVERWYGELDGSLFGLTTGTAGFVGFRPSVEFFSDSRDWEMHSINVSWPVMANVGATAGALRYRIVCHMFSASGGYNPIQFNQVGPFGPQLVTNANFDQGTVRSLAGVSPTNSPFGQGYTMADFTMRVGMRGTLTEDQVSDAFSDEYIDGAMVDREIGFDKKMQNTIFFQRPLRVKRGRRITVQLFGSDDTFFYNPAHSLFASIVYTELPNPRQNYRTP